jgi:hypothetical protein
MVVSRNRQMKFFFKLLLLTVYFAFFSVQLFLRYTSSHSLQSLDGNDYQKSNAEKPALSKTFVAQKDNKKNKNLSYLNKRFHPKDEVTVPSHHFQVQSFYTELTIKFFFRDEHITASKINSASLRGPPVIG